MIAAIIILSTIAISLVIYDINLHKKVQTYQNQNNRFRNLNVVIQDFMNITGSELSVDKKIQKINEIIIEKYQVKYSTIVIFDGTDYIVKASNVNQNHWENLRKLHEKEIFKDSIDSASPKYITINRENEKLPYQENEFDRAKSAIFFPLYIDNVYIGYWIIESGVPHDFDNIDTLTFETVKENIVLILRTIDYQKILENIVRKDLFSGLNSAEYLYGEGKKQIDQYTFSCICMFRISNIERINYISRELGNKVITQVAKCIQENISNNYIFVRYMGPKFVIVFCGVEPENVKEFISYLRETAQSLKVSLKEENNNDIVQIDLNAKNKKSKKKKIEEIEVSPTLNFVVANYYKGTGIEEVLQKLEKHLDDAPKEASEMNNV